MLCLKIQSRNTVSSRFFSMLTNDDVFREDSQTSHRRLGEGVLSWMFLLSQINIDF